MPGGEVAKTRRRGAQGSLRIGHYPPQRVIDGVATCAIGSTNSSCPSANPVFPYPGASLAVSQYSSSGAILWALDNENSCLSVNQQPPVLYAYDATNIAGAPLFSSSAGTGCAVRFTIPTVVNGHVYVGNGSQLVVFH